MICHVKPHSKTKGMRKRTRISYALLWDEMCVDPPESHFANSSRLSANERERSDSIREETGLYYICGNRGVIRVCGA